MFCLAFQIFHSAVCGFKSYFICQLGVLKKAGKNKEPPSIFLWPASSEFWVSFWNLNINLIHTVALINIDYSLPGALVDDGVQKMPLLHVKSNCQNFITFSVRMVTLCWRLLFKSNLLYFI